MAEAQTFSVQALIFVVILMIYILTSHMIQVKNMSFIHQSTVAIFMGILTALFCKFVLEVQIQFNNQFFFTIILPPIIFSAGYSLRKSLFFQNFYIIVFLGVIGTLICFVCLALFIEIMNTYIFHVLTIKQVMMVSSLLCATDTVAAMALIKPEKYPVLNAVLFGEGIINDAVAIILFRTVQDLEIGQGSVFSVGLVIQMGFSFLYLFFFSIALGILTGFGLSYLFKVNPSFTKYPLKQTSLILLNGYLTYLIGQQLGLSGIISLFTCAIIMGHYCFLNISQQSQRGTGLAFQTVGYISEAFIFAYLGASVISINGQWLAVGMSFAILIVFPLIRALMVYLLPFYYNCRKKQFPLNGRQLKVCWYSGMVRGVIAFALCLKIETDNPQTDDFIKTITLVIVLLTTIFGAVLLKAFAKWVGFQDENGQGEHKYDIMKQKGQRFSEMTPSSNFRKIGLISSSDSESISKKVQSEGQQTRTKKFQRFEKQYIKPFFEKQKVTYQLKEEDNIYDQEHKQNDHL